MYIVHIFFKAEDGIRDGHVTGVQTCALPISMKLYQLLKEPIPSKDRETVIKQVDELIEQRGNLLQDIIPPFTEKEKKIGEEIVLFNEHIQKQMHVLFVELKEEMKQVKKDRKR